MKFLDLGNNLFNGSIPSSIDNLKELQLLDLNSNQLVGGEIIKDVFLTARFGGKIRILSIRAH